MRTAITDIDRDYIFTNFNVELIKKIRESSKRNTYNREKIKNQFKNGKRII